MSLLLLYKIIFLLTAFGAGAIAIDIFLKKTARPKFDTLFGLMSLAFVCWAAGRLGLLITTDQSGALLWVHFLYIGSILVHLFFFHTILVFLGVERVLINRVLLTLFYILGALLLIVNSVYFFTGESFFISDVVQKLSFRFYEVPDAWYNLHLLNYLILPTYALALMFVALRHASGQRREQINWVILASFVGFFGGNSVVPLVYNIPFEPFLLVLVPFYLPVLAYAITKYHLFNIKVVTTELFTFSLWAFILIRTFVAENAQEQTANLILLVLSVLIGVFLIRSVYKEVEQRERIEKLAKELETANKGQENLIHTLSHEVKGELAHAGSAFASILEGDYNDNPPAMKEMLKEALRLNRRDVAGLEQTLLAFNPKLGTEAYEMQEFDFKDALLETADNLRAEAEAKKLALEVRADKNESYRVNGDREKIISRLLHNLIENAILFTPTGGIKIDLRKKDGGIFLAVKDTGVGIAPEDKRALFTKGGHGKNSIKVNVHSTGNGLYLAKTVVEKHGGKIWAESEGAGKGASFFVELPIA